MQVVHKEFLDLLPWYVNGTLPEGERAKLELHLKECLPCHSALKEERRIQDLVRAQDDVPVGPEHGIASLLSRIDNDTSRSRRRAFRRPALGYGVAAALGGLLVWLVVTTPGFENTDLDDAAFSTLSTGNGSSEPRIDIVFDGSPSQSEIEAFFDEFGGELIAGPTEIGRYTVALPAESGVDLPELIERLGTDARVRFVGRSFIDPEGGQEISP